MATVDTNALAITHTSRMLRRLAELPDHPRKAEYARQFKIYAGDWARLTVVEQDAAFQFAGDPRLVPDMTPALAMAAIAVLER